MRGQAKCRLRALRPAARAATSSRGCKRWCARCGARRSPPAPASHAGRFRAADASCSNLAPKSCPPADVVDGIAQIEEKLAALLAEAQAGLQAAARHRHDAPPGGTGRWAGPHASRRNRGEARPSAGPRLRRRGQADHRRRGLRARPGRRRHTTSIARENYVYAVKRVAGKPAARGAAGPDRRAARQPALGQDHALEQQRRSAIRARCAGLWRSTAARSCPSPGRASTSGRTSRGPRFADAAGTAACGRLHHL